jgi:transposase
VIHDLNERGFGALDPDYRGGRPRKTTPAQRDRVVAVARTRTDHQGVALTRWSIQKLAAHLDELGIAARRSGSTSRGGEHRSQSVRRMDCR